ncbi:Gfo/Idh/MocA family oxidoreductase [Patescibacteria group bacterium]|nr:Gfo/Idh/MocA family oxidoreductase [Patescibacteria group bacterium]MBU4023307.1 Gfo/Idh/MocA family oxidoreductase [Patescibacteria group bacterium]
MRVGIIGLGRQGWRRAEAIKQTSDKIIIGATEKINENSNLFSKSFECEVTNNWKDLVKRKDIDIVVVCTPPNLHKDMVISALRAKKHVLCEKPLALNVEEAKTILKEVKKSGHKLKCGFNIRHHPSISLAKKWVDKGLIGKLIFIRCRYGIVGREGYEKDWRVKKEISGGGQLMDQGMHALDLSRWFLGEFKEVIGSISTNFWKIAPLEDNVFAILKTKEDQTAFCHISWTQWKNLFSFEIYGEDGYLTSEGLGGSYGLENLVFGKRDFKKPFTQKIIKFKDKDFSWLEEWKEFTSAIKKDQQPMGSGYDGFMALKLAEALYKSAKTKKMVKLNQDLR